MSKILTSAIISFALISTPVLAKGSRHHHNSSSIANSIARAEGVNPALVSAIIHVESTGNCGARSSAGALGIMQVKPATARSVGVHGNLLKCENSLLAGVRYIKQALRLNRGNVCAAASSYNTGLGVRGRCSGYGRKVVARMGHRVHYASYR